MGNCMAVGSLAPWCLIPAPSVVGPCGLRGGAELGEKTRTQFLDPLRGPSNEHSALTVCFAYGNVSETLQLAPAGLLLFVENEIFAFQAEAINIITQNRRRNYLLFPPYQAKPSLALMGAQSSL